MKKFYLTFLFALSSIALFAQIYVTEAGGTAPRDGQSWATAYNKDELQTAINSATAGQQVWVAKGTYKPTENLSTTGFLTGGAVAVTNRDRAFILKAGVEIYGGFAGGELAISNRIDINTTNETILSGDLNNNNTADAGDAYHVVASRNNSAGAVLDGFTIQHGFANGSGTITEGGVALSQKQGAAIIGMGANAHATYRHLLIKNNKATDVGGAVYLYGENNTSVFEKCKFYSNEATGSGGALYIIGSAGSFLIVNSLFYNNISDAEGGAIYHNRGGANLICTATLINNTFYANKAVGIRGGYSFNGYAEVKINLYNNLFNGNLANYNKTTQTGDLAVASSDIRDATSATQLFRYNLFQTNKTSGTNRAVDNVFLLNTTTPEPVFDSTTPTDDANFLRLATNSFALNKGNNSLYPGNINTDTDLGGAARLMGTIIDLGAYEYQGTLPVTINSFTANLVNGRTQLKWSVGTEDNVKRYEIERSQNGTDFEKVAVTTANGSFGYTITDANPQLGINYYRLVTVDNDGSENHYEGIQTVKVTSLATARLQAYPNPFSGTATINVSLSGYPFGNYVYKLVNATGSIVQHGKLYYNGSSVVLNLSATLAKGIYILYISNGANDAQLKLIKQ